MRRKAPYFVFALLLLIVWLAVPCFGIDPPTKRVRGVIVGYVWDTLLLVRTTKKQLVAIRHKSSGMNPLPEVVLREERVWDFEVTSLKDCTIPMSFFRFRMFELGHCGNEYPQENPQPITPIIYPPYPQLSFFNQEFKTELDAISDETVLSCYSVDFGRSKPGYKERLLTGVVLSDDNVPIPEFPVSVGFSGKKVGYLYVLTDADGRFSIPVYEKFSYWIKAGLTIIEGQRQYRSTFVPKRKFVPPLTLKLEYE